MTVVVWFRRDLRVQDNPALMQAIADARQKGLAVEAVYVHSPEDEGEWAIGSASRWYLRHSLVAHQRTLAELGIPVRCFKGDALEVLNAYTAQIEAAGVYWNRVVEPGWESRDQAVRASLQAAGLTVRTFEDDCLIMPEQLRKQEGNPYRVFTPFWRRARSLIDIETLHQRRLGGSPAPIGRVVEADAETVDGLGLLQGHAWHGKLHRHWKPGEAMALENLRAFIESPITDYEIHRDRPDIAGTSRLSPALHFGEVSVARVFALCEQALVFERQERARAGIQCFLSEIGWREFARHVLHAFPQTVDHSLDERFERKGAWREDPAGRLLHAWQRGETGIALVDAGMRQLWETGWMHNRVRMVAASFLTKNMGIHWREGARWFWDTLVDADLPSNTLGWQWVAGCGTDAAPYFRIFNPDTQASKFDPQQRYRWQWLGDEAPHSPIVDLKRSRAEALDRYQSEIRGPSR